MVGGKWVVGAIAAFCLAPAAAWGQASFGPIQPFAGAPSPVYVAAPYAAPTLLAPVGAPPMIAPQMQYPAPTIGPPVITAPPVTAPGCCGASASYGAPVSASVAYRPALPATAPRSIYLGSGNYGQPNVYMAGQPLYDYLRYFSP